MSLHDSVIFSNWTKTSVCFPSLLSYIVDNIFPKIYKHNTHKFQILYNTPKCLKAFTDGLFAMIKREADGVINGASSTKLSVYSVHDTTIIRTYFPFPFPLPISISQLIRSNAKCINPFPTQRRSSVCFQYLH